MAANQTSTVGIALLFIFILALLLVLAIAATQGKSLVSGMIANQRRRLNTAVVLPITITITQSSGTVPLTVGEKDLTVSIVSGSSASDSGLVLNLQPAGRLSVGRTIVIQNKRKQAVKLIVGRRVSIIGVMDGTVTIDGGKGIRLIGTDVDRYIVEPL